MNIYDDWEDTFPFCVGISLSFSHVDEIIW